MSGTSAHSYSGFRVLSTPHLYGKVFHAFVLYSVGGLCVFLFERDIKQDLGGTGWPDADGNYFSSSFIIRTKQNKQTNKNSRTNVMTGFFSPPRYFYTHFV